MKEKGEITVFLSLVSVLMLSFILAMLEGTIIQTAKNQAYLLGELALYSVFGEYQKELFDDYNVFALEGTYETGTFSEEDVIHRMRYYGSDIEEQKVADIQFLTDNMGQGFKEQVFYYMEENYGIELVRDVIGWDHNWEQQEIEGQQLEEADKEAMEELWEQLAESEEELHPNSLISQMSNPRGRSVMSLIFPKEVTVSTKSITWDIQPSNRSLQVGRGVFPANSSAQGLEGKALFGEYVISNFNNAASQIQKDKEGNFNEMEQAVEAGEEGLRGRTLDYEVEYILEGQSSDRQNLERIALKLMAIRMGVNYLYLRGDTEKMTQVRVMAASIVAVAPVPFLVAFIEKLIIFAWVFGESIMDLRALYAGKKAPLIKCSETWQLSISSMLELGKDDNNLPGRDSEDGMSYADYLRTMLFTSNYNTITMRAIDRVEENIRHEHEKSFFKADNCISKIRIDNTKEIRNDISYSFQLYFGYL